MLLTRAFAPVSIGNFIVGFDTLGAALAPADGGEPLGDIVQVEPATRFEFVLTGSYADRLPGALTDNIVVTADAVFHRALTARRIVARPRRLTLEKRLPVGSGLGSSASSIVAALVALNAFYDGPLTPDELLTLAGELEGQISGGIHYDNVAPTLLGGLQLLLPDAEAATTGQRCAALPVPADWLFVVHYPGIEVSTRMAREILPRAYSLAQAVRFGQRLAAFVDALHRRDSARAARLLTDELVEPYRTPLVPGLETARRAALQAGALAFGLSGSGPTCVAVTDSAAKATEIQRVIEAAMPTNAHRFTRLCQLDPVGARLL